jgi:pimeloyl-ACP methyl ester carboxylesterase
LISPFTTLRDEAAYVVGGMLSHVLVENYDNRQNLRTVFQKNAGVRVAIFHGTNDDTIPIQMGRELKKEFPAVDFFPIEGADHGDVVYYSRDKIISWMTR